MTTTSNTIRISGLARRLVSEGLLTEQQALEAQRQAAQNKQSLVSWLVSKGMVDASAIASAASQEYGAPLFDLDATDPEQMPISLVDEKLIIKHRACRCSNVASACSWRYQTPLITRGSTRSSSTRGWPPTRCWSRKTSSTRLWNVHSRRRTRR